MYTENKTFTLNNINDFIDTVDKYKKLDIALTFYKEFIGLLKDKALLYPNDLKININYTITQNNTIINRIEFKSQETFSNIYVDFKNEKASYLLFINGINEIGNRAIDCEGLQLISTFPVDDINTYTDTKQNIQLLNDAALEYEHTFLASPRIMTITGKIINNNTYIDEIEVSTDEYHQNNLLNINCLTGDIIIEDENKKITKKYNNRYKRESALEEILNSMHRHRSETSKLEEISK